MMTTSGASYFYTVLLGYREQFCHDPIVRVLAHCLE